MCMTSLAGLTSFKCRLPKYEVIPSEWLTAYNNHRHGNAVRPLWNRTCSFKMWFGVSCTVSVEAGFYFIWVHQALDFNKRNCKRNQKKQRGCRQDRRDTEREYKTILNNCSAEGNWGSQAKKSDIRKAEDMLIIHLVQIKQSRVCLFSLEYIECHIVYMTYEHN